MTRIFMSAGEPSGVAIGAALMRTLKRRLGEVEFIGLGGPGMVAEGLDQIYDPASTATMWLWGNLKRIPAHRRALTACIESWEARRPEVVVTIDYQAFHLYVGMRARERGIPVVHYVSSQFWARRYYTLEFIRKAYSHVLLIHEFEKVLYEEAGIEATFVGHPLFERLDARETDAPLLERLLSRQAPRLGLLPGSRHAEIVAGLPVMLAAVGRLRPRPSLLVSAARKATRPFVERRVERAGLEAEIVDLGSGEILQAADLALITSGSASLEAVYYGCPAVVLYKLNPINYFFAKPHITSAIAQPNLIAGREVVPEYLLPWRGGRRLAEATQRLLDDEDARERQRTEFARIRERLLAGPRPSEAAADVVLRYLS